jgi:hypothetical protein
LKQFPNSNTPSEDGRWSTLLLKPSPNVKWYSEDVKLSTLSQK